MKKFEWENEILFEWEKFSHSKKFSYSIFLNIFNGFNMNKCEKINREFNAKVKY